MDDKGVVSFTDLIMSFSSSVLYYLRRTQIEGRYISKVNFPLAKQNLDIIAMLQKKTKNNLTKDESSLLADVLKDLQQQYLEITSEKQDKKS